MLRWFKKKRYSYHITYCYINKTGGLSFSDRSVQVTEKISYGNKGIGKLKRIFEKENEINEVVILNIVKL